MLSALRSWKSWLFILASAGLLWGEAAWSVEKIRLGLSTRNVVLMPFYYARDKALRQVRAGRRNHSNQEQSSVSRTRLGRAGFHHGYRHGHRRNRQGMPVKAVAVLYRAPLFSLLSQLPNAKSLEGKKISVSESALKVISTESSCLKKAVWIPRK